MSQDTSAKSAAGFGVFDRDLPVHEDPIDAFRIFVRIVLERVRVGPQVRRTVSHAWQVENDEVRGGSRSDQAAIAEAQACRRHPRHFVNGVFEREDGFFDHETLEDSWELAEGTGLVGCARRGSLLFGSDPAIRTDHDERVA